MCVDLSIFPLYLILSGSNMPIRADANMPIQGFMIQYDGVPWHLSFFSKN